MTTDNETPQTCDRKELLQQLLLWRPPCPHQQNSQTKSDNCEALQSRSSCCVGWTYTMRRFMQEVAPGVFLGPLSSAVASNLQVLVESNVTHIVCVRGPCEASVVRPKFPDQFKYLVLEIADKPTENIIPHFSKVRDFIDESIREGGKTLVHGTGGVSRSAALVLAYIMEKYNLSYKEAYHHLQKRRFCINPNLGFAAQLIDFEAIYRAKAALKASNNNCETGGRGSKRPLDDLFSDSDNMDIN